MAAIKSARGLNSRMRFFLNGPEVVLNAKSWKVKPNTTKVTDSVCGEDRDRLDVVVNYFELTLECFNTDFASLDAALSDITNSDTQVAPLDKAAGVKVNIRDGTKKAYVCKEMVLDDWDLGGSARADAIMTTFNLRFRYFDKTKATP